MHRITQDDAGDAIFLRPFEPCQFSVNAKRLANKNHLTETRLTQQDKTGDIMT
jgi:hypothetical protein